MNESIVTKSKFTCDGYHIYFDGNNNYDDYYDYHNSN